MFGIFGSKKKKSRVTRDSRRLKFGFENLEGRDLCAADGNDSLSGALNMGSYSGVAATVTRTGGVGTTSDNQDYYKFTLSSSNTAKVSLTGLSQDLDVELQNSSGTRITASTNGSSSSESAQANLVGGTYYIRIYKGTSSAVSSYSLRLDLGDDSTSSAFNIGSYSTSTNSYTRSGSVGGNDTQDYYKFVSSGSNHLVVNLSGLSDDLDVQLLNSSGSTVTSGTKGGTSSELLDALVGSGTYYVRVFQGTSGATSNYSLSLKFGDDSTSAATSFGTLSTSSSSFSSSISTSDVQDYYKFTISSSRTVSLSLFGLSQDLDVKIIDGVGTTKASGTRTGTSSESLSVFLSAGTYYVKVYPGVTSASSNYTVSMHA